MTEQMVDFKLLEAELVESDTVVFHLENGATVKVRVSLERVVLALNMKNPEGSDLYNFNANMQFSVIPAEKTFSIPRSQLSQATQQPKPPDPRQVA